MTSGVVCDCFIALILRNCSIVIILRDGKWQFHSHMASIHPVKLIKHIKHDIKYSITKPAPLFGLSKSSL